MRLRRSARCCFFSFSYACSGPGREVLHLAAVVFFVACPVVMKSAAMFHPEPLSMLLSTAALVLAARLLVHSDYRFPPTVALGLTLGLAQLVRAWTLWTVGVVVVVLVVAADHTAHVTVVGSSVQPR